MIINLLLAIGILIFLIGLGAEVHSESSEAGYILSRVGMVVFAIGMLAYMVREFQPKNKNHI
jgi:uncharacterized membrane protein YiaA